MRRNIFAISSRVMQIANLARKAKPVEKNSTVRSLTPEGKDARKSIFVTSSRPRGHQLHPPHPSRRQFNQAGYRQPITAISGLSKLIEQSLDGQKRHLERAATMICCRLVAQLWCTFKLQDQGGQGVLITMLTRPRHSYYCAFKKIGQTLI